MSVALSTVRHVPIREVAELVKSLRVALGLTQETAAQLGGLARTEWVKIENGRNKASTDNIRTAIANAFGLTRDEVDEFLTGRAPVGQMLRVARTRTKGRTIEMEPRYAPIAAVVEANPDRWSDTAVDMAYSAAFQAVSMTEQSAIALLDGCAALLRGTLRTVPIDADEEPAPPRARRATK